MDDEIKRLEELVKQGDANAMNTLGVMYYAGQGVSKDWNKALGLFRKAGDLGNTIAKKNFFKLYKKELEIEIKSDNSGIAMMNLGYLYEFGLGVEKNLQKAKELYEMAYTKVNPRDAFEAISRIESKISREKSVKKSLEQTTKSPIKMLESNDIILDSKVNEEIEKLKSLIKDLSSKYISREQTVRMLANNIYHGRRVIKEIKDNKTIRDNINTILLISSTGGGKTAIISDLAKEFDVPYTSVSLSAGYTQAGYVGLSLQDIFKKLISAADGDVEKAQEGIIILDEFDKIRTKEDSHDEEFKRALQQELLSYLEGREIQLDTKGGPTTFNTSKLTFILAGAFQDITEYDMNYSDEDIKEAISKGYESELLGRIGIYHYMPKYTKEDYINILNNSKISPLSNFIVSCSIHGKNVITSPYSPFIESVAEEAVKLDKGVRGLNSIFANILKWYLDDLIYGENDISLMESYEDIKKKKGRGK